MPNKHNSEADNRTWQQIKQAIIGDVTDLLEHHEEAYRSIADEAEIPKIKLSFGAAIDLSESTPSLETTVSYSQVVKDKRTHTFDDPNQVSLPFNGEGQTETASGALAEEAGEGPVEAHKRRRKKSEPVVDAEVVGETQSAA